MEINGESTSMVWPTLGSRKAKEQNRTDVEEILLFDMPYVRRLSPTKLCYGAQIAIFA